MKHELLRMGLRQTRTTRGAWKCMGEADMIVTPDMLRVGVTVGLVLSGLLNIFLLWFATEVWTDNIRMRIALGALEDFHNAKTGKLKSQGASNDDDHEEKEEG